MMISPPASHFASFTIMDMKRSSCSKLVAYKNIKMPQCHQVGLFPSQIKVTLAPTPEFIIQRNVPFDLGIGCWLYFCPAEFFKILGNTDLCSEKVTHSHCHLVSRMKKRRFWRNFLNPSESESTSCVSVAQWLEHCSATREARVRSPLTPELFFQFLCQSPARDCWFGRFRDEFRRRNCPGQYVVYISKEK